MRLVRVQALVEELRGSFWVIPAGAVVGGVLLGAVLPRVHLHPSGTLSAYLFSAGADGARQVLSAIASSVITVTSLTFSLTVVTLQLASQQFSPRLLRTFLRDLRNQAVLGIFLATVVYSLTVLRQIRTATQGTDAVVPYLAVTVGYILMLVSVGALVWFIHHVVDAIRIDTVMNGVRKETLRVVEGQTEPAGEGDEPVDPVDRQAPDLAPDAVPVAAVRSGFLLAVDQPALATWARHHDVTVAVDVAVGEWMLKGAPWARLSVQDRSTDVAPLGRSLSEQVAIGVERTRQQDIGFGVRQLVDIAAKALSPGVNDPTTAVHALYQLADLLAALARRPLGPTATSDDDGRLRVVVQAPTFDDYLESVCGQVRRYGAGEPAVGEALLGLLAGVGQQVKSEARRDAVRRQVDALAADAARELVSEHDQRLFADRVSQARETLAGAVPPRTAPLPPATRKAAHRTA